MSGTTLQRYRQLLRYLHRPATPEIARLAAMPLDRLSAADLETALLSLLAAPAERRWHLSPHSIRHLAGLLGVALHKAFRLDAIRENPMLKVELPKLETVPPRALAPEELQRLLAVCRARQDWTYAFADLAAASGCRRGELLALEWFDFDWRTRTVTVSKSLEQTRAGLRLKGTKSGRVRSLVLPAAAVETLADHRFRAPGILVFPGPDGDYLPPHQASQIIARRLRSARIRGACLHTLRHTHASVLLSRGVPLPVIAARLGHASPDVTARIYCHALPADDRRAADEWDRLLAGAGE